MSLKRRDPARFPRMKARGGRRRHGQRFSQQQTVLLEKQRRDAEAVAAAFEAMRAAFAEMFGPFVEWLNHVGRALLTVEMPVVADAHGPVQIKAVD